MSVKETPFPSGQSVVFDRPCVLLVEGPDDRAFAAKQIEFLSSPDAWHVHFMVGNSTNWSGLLDVIQKSDPFQDFGVAIGIILDSDLNPAAAADKARGFFRDAGLPVPPAHGEIADGTIRTGFFLMPSASQTGALEELLLDGVDPTRRELAETYIATVSRSLEPPKKTSKAIIQAYLAGQVDHVKSIPVAVKKIEVIDPDSAAFRPFRTFLEELTG